MKKNSQRTRALKLTAETIKNLRREELVPVVGGTDPSILTCEETVCVTRIKCDW